MKTYNLFISHSWTYTKQYVRLRDLLNERPFFSFRNYSVPRDNPIHTTGTHAELCERIRARMQPCHVILVLAGVYVHYSKWIDKELDLAESGFDSPKPIVAIEPWGSERTSVRVKRAADRIVKWNTDAVVRAIRDVG